MRKIVLFCAVGMSTSMLVSKMKAAAAESNYECEIIAHPMSAINDEGPTADIILLGPQVRYNLNLVQKTCPEVPVEAINMVDYGTMNGAKVLSHVKKILGD